MTFDLNVHDPDKDKRSEFRTHLKCYSIFSDLCRYFTNHLLENTHIWAISTMHGWLVSTYMLQMHGNMPIGVG